MIDDIALARIICEAMKEAPCYPGSTPLLTVGDMHDVLIDGTCDMVKVAKMVREAQDKRGGS